MKTIFSIRQYLRTAFLGAGLLAAMNAHSTLIAGWDFSGESQLATSTADVSVNANLDNAPILTRGIGATASTGANSFRTQGFQNNGISTANTDYFQVTFSAASGYTLSLSTIDARFAGTATYVASPGVSSQFAYSLDGTTFILIGSAVQSTSLTMGQIDLTGISALQNVVDTTTVYFRYYASGQTATGGWGFNSPAAGQDGLDFGGTLNAVPGAVPEPGEWGLISALGLLGICSVSTWRRHHAVRRSALARL